MNDLTVPDKGAARPSKAQAQQDRINYFMGELEKRQDQLTTLLSDSNIDPKVFMAVARRAFMKTPELLDCDSKSVLESFINCATDGLKPDGKQASLVIYNVNVAARNEPKRYVKKAQYIAGYQGMLDIAYRSGNFKVIGARVVYEGDEYSYTLGIGQTVTHKPKARPAGTTPPIVAAYAFAITKDGGEFFEPFEGNDVKKVMAVSRAVSGPAKDWPEEMTRKGPLRRMYKYIPKDDRMARLAARDDDTLEFYADDEREEMVPVTERKLHPGFAPAPEPAQLTQDSTLPMDMVQDDEREALEAEFEDAGQTERPQANAAPEPNDMAEVRDATDEEVDRANRAGLRDGETTVHDDLMASRQEAPELPDTFLLNLRNAGSWLNIKQALRTIFKDERVWPIASHLRAAAWRRFQELHAEGSERTDFVNDPILFRCWIDGENPGAEDLERNYALLQKDAAYQKLADEEKDRIAKHVEEARG